MVVSLQRWLWRSALVVGLLLAGSALAEEEEVHRAEEILVEDDFVRPAEVFEAGPVEREVLTREDIETMPAQNAA